ncbi:hypothetical protein FHW84_002688 [Dyella sp. SG562]|uniref:hypothetical protein n=1 Tax=Dyella sp. SG562 TaxID=2587017 RepID=UPI00141FCB99|nr:hypothetical protein [Dyella sp. SG562]NII74103.1 hypothetical protein [Dyella sp. SG562]
MRTSLLSFPVRLAAAALTLGMAIVAQATDTPTTPAADHAMHIGQPAAESDSADRIDWNIDYPSQLGPEGPQAGSNTHSVDNRLVIRKPSDR